MQIRPPPRFFSAVGSSSPHARHAPAHPHDEHISLRRPLPLHIDVHAPQHEEPSRLCVRLLGLQEQGSYDKLPGEREREHAATALSRETERGFQEQHQSFAFAACSRYVPQCEG